MSLKSQYNSMGEFRTSKPNEYIRACKEGLLPKIAELYGWEYMKKKYSWTLEEFLETTNGCDNYSHWRKKEATAYRAACKHKMTDNICDAKGWTKRKKNGYWTKEKCIEDARKYTSVISWRKNSSGAADAAQENKWMKECKAHMIYKNKPDGYWTKEKCRKEALKFKYRKDWRSASKGSYSSAQRNGWLHELSTHMISLRPKRNYYD